MRWTIPLVSLLVAACASSNNPKFQPIIEAQDDVQLSVRKVQVNSDIAVIRPDYQIVIGAPASVGHMSNQAVWMLSKEPPAAKPTPVREAAPRAASAPEQRKVQPTVQTLHLENTHFDTASSAIKSPARAMLDQAVSKIEEMAPNKISIIGHADSVGSHEYNQKLSERRAEAVFNYLRSKGLKIEAVERIGFGEQAPVAENTTASGRAQNRRAEIIATVTK